VRDVEGKRWGVRQIRPTRHGFDLLFGSPTPDRKSLFSGLPRLIATRSLIEFWAGNRTRYHGFLFDLPAGRTTLKRVRHRFGFHWKRDMARFWKDRMHDLQTLTPREFAARHDVSLVMVKDARFRLLGRRARDLGWWLAPQPLAILRSKLVLREMAERLHISITHAARLRNRARQIE
jgi:hypothetical protein